jgi:hypothetical protein
LTAAITFFGLIIPPHIAKLRENILSRNYASMFTNLLKNMAVLLNLELIVLKYFIWYFINIFKKSNSFEENYKLQNKPKKFSSKFAKSGKLF